MSIVSIVFSFRNEVDNIPELIKRSKASLEKIDIEYEIIFINDYSTDGSLDLLKKYNKKDKRIKIINMSRNFGITPSILAGFKYAKGDSLIYLDSDLQDPPELFPKLIKKWREGFDIIHTTRKKRLGENRVKLFLTNVAYYIINKVANINIRRDSGDFKLLSRRAINNIINLNEYDPFLRGIPSWIGFKQTNIFYIRQPRFDGETKFSLMKFGTNPYKEFIRGVISFSTAPLYVSFIFGSISLIFLSSYFIYKAYLYIFQGNEISVLFLLSLSNLWFGSFILFTIGILGIYLGNIHESVKNRPRYIIDSFIGFDR